MSLACNFALREIPINGGLFPPQGNSKLASGDAEYGGGSVLAEGFAGFADSEAGASVEGERGVAEICEAVPAGADAASVFIHGDVAHPVQAVLDRPVVAPKREQPLGGRFGGLQAGERIGDLDAFLGPDPSAALDSQDLGKSWPAQIRDRLGRGREGARFDAAVPLVEARGGPGVRRRLT